MKNTDLKFITKLIWKMIGWSLIVLTLIFGYLMDCFYFEKKASLICIDFSLFLIGVSILMWKKDKPENTRSKILTESAKRSVKNLAEAFAEKDEARKEMQSSFTFALGKMIEQAQRRFIVNKIQMNLFTFHILKDELEKLTNTKLNDSDYRFNGLPVEIIEGRDVKEILILIE